MKGRALSVPMGIGWWARRGVALPAVQCALPQACGASPALPTSGFAYASTDEQRRDSTPSEASGADCGGGSVRGREAGLGSPLTASCPLQSRGGAL